MPKRKKRAPSTPAASEDSRLIRPDDLARRLGIGRRTLDRREQDGAIGPRRLQIGARVVAWDRLEVEAWLTHRTPEGGLYNADGWAAVRDQVLGTQSVRPPGAPGSSNPGNPRNGGPAANPSQQAHAAGARNHGDGKERKPR